MSVKQFIEKDKDRLLEELMALLRIPSVSADSAYKKDMLSAAEFLKIKLLEAGVDSVEICPTAGHPIVYAEKIMDPSWPTVLVYGHYDVQPPDPIELWESGPFEPIIKTTDRHPEGAIFARGACDDKGQMYMHVKAFEYMMREQKMYCNIKFMLEGEEEVGSPNLGPFMRENQERLACDVILISDTSMLGNESPSMTSGLRGLSYVEVEVTGPNRDLHSGTYGGAVANPINILAKMIASLQDEEGRITVEGFYDDVLEVSAEEREAMAKAPFDLADYKAKLGIDDVAGEAGFSTMERASIRPTLDVNGIWGGYIGEGAKTVLPSKAYAKISMRLVPNQSSEQITALFKKHFEALAPASVKVVVTPHHGGEPVLTPTDGIEFQAAAKAYEQTFGKRPIPLRAGGSIPIVALFEEILGAKTVMMGFGLDTDAIHSPNEHFGVFNYFKGIETLPYFYEHFRAMKEA